jgi:hypothetical protein
MTSRSATAMRGSIALAAGLVSYACAASQVAISGSIDEDVSREIRSSGSRFVGVVLGELPGTVAARSIQVVSHDRTDRSRCIKLTSADGVYRANGELRFAFQGFAPLAVPGFTRHPQLLGSMRGTNFAGLLVDAAACAGDAAPEYAEPIYFAGDRRRVNVAVNSGGALSVKLAALAGEAQAEATCSRVEGRAVAFDHWCVVRLEPAWRMVTLQLNLLASTTTRTPVHRLVLRLPAN